MLGFGTQCAGLSRMPTPEILFPHDDVALFQELRGFREELLRMLTPVVGANVRRGQIARALVSALLRVGEAADGSEHHLSRVLARARRCLDRTVILIQSIVEDGFYGARILRFARERIFTLIRMMSEAPMASVDRVHHADPAESASVGESRVEDQPDSPGDKNEPVSRSTVTVIGDTSLHERINAIQLAVGGSEPTIAIVRGGVAEEFFHLLSGFVRELA